ncbi:MAG: 16S rRNA (uracil(1498)-N(3))-methyltransferase [Verrucomicrobia bacterium]|nr:16S rRNA (uracil(1498)-N(3))-methyltransferase [Verrucomicrobiota bacterium]
MPTLSGVNLILIEAAEVGAEGRVELRDGRAEHLRTVLRAAPGLRVRIGLLDGPVGTGEVESAGSESVVLRCVFDGPVPAWPPVDLLLALPRPKVMKRLWAQLAALGVGRILLTNAEKVERMYFDTHVLEPGLVRERLIEGLQQACDTRLPVVTIHRRLKVLLEDELDALCPDTFRVAADPSFDRTLPAAMEDCGGRRLLLAIGPEGGWTPYELDLLARHGFAGVGLGPRILRADTACVALLAQAQAGGGSKPLHQPVHACAVPKLPA